MKNLDPKVISFIKRSRVGRLATIQTDGRPHIVPICYAFLNKNLYTPLDKKPKKVSVAKLKRVKNIEQNPDVSVVIDKYSENWDKLCYVIIHGKASLIKKGREYDDAIESLVSKYDQYKEMNLKSLGYPVIKIVSTKIISWGKFE